MCYFKSFIKKYPQCWTLLYIFIYFPWFFYMEKKVTIASGFTVIHTWVDDLIPFCEYFIIPYLLWFVFIIGTVLFFLFKRSKEEFYKLTAIMFIGMTISLIIYTIFPNGQTMRPPVNPYKNIFSWMLVQIYKNDTCTNVFPSLHVFVSLAANVGWWNSEISKAHKWIKPCSAVLTISICLSTVFLKQHSFLDGMAASLICIILYFLVYQRELTKEAFGALSERAKAAAKQRKKQLHL